jgi:hypothetical protein
MGIQNAQPFQVQAFPSEPRQGQAVKEQGKARRVATFAVLVFPAPLGPSSPTSWPRWNDAPPPATVLPNDLWRLVIVSTGYGTDWKKTSAVPL